MKAGFFNLKTKDFIKGLILAVITAVITFLTDMLNLGVEFEWKKILITSVIAMLSYLVKNLFTNSEDEFLKKEQS